MARRRSVWRQAQRDLYFTQRTMGDLSATQNGRLGKRLVRRYLTRAFFQALRRKG